MPEVINIDSLKGLEPIIDYLNEEEVKEETDFVSPNSENPDACSDEAMLSLNEGVFLTLKALIQHCQDYAILYNYACVKGGSSICKGITYIWCDCSGQYCD